MSRIKNRLTTRSVESKKVKGYYADGGNLYLRVTKSQTKSWIFYYVKNGVRTEMGLGSIANVTLEQARERAAELRKQLANGCEPLAEKKRIEAEKKLQQAKAMTFEQCTAAYINAHKAGWKNPKHLQQWQNTLAQYVFPIFGDFDVQAIDTTLIVRCLEAIWLTKNETACRVRGRIEVILDWATARKLRSGENPARWRGHLDKLLVKPTKIQNTEHHSALPYSEMHSFMQQLRQQDGIAAKCLEFTILTATRTGESIGAMWDEIDMANQVWIIPAQRMKVNKEHRVPLSNDTLRILHEMSAIRLSDYVFPSNRKGLSNMAMLTLLKRMQRTDITVHGFRSTFRDWAAEETSYSSEVVEMALAHTIKNQVEAAYRRGDLLEKRSILMESWARYCNGVLN